MEHDPIRVLVVDDDERLCSAWARLVSWHPDLLLVGVIHCADRLVAEVLERQPDVVLLDLMMPGENPLEAMRQAIAQRPATRVLIYSGYNDEETERHVAQAGARGLVDKLAEPADIIRAIRKIAGGQTFFRYPVPRSIASAGR